MKYGVGIFYHIDNSDNITGFGGWQETAGYHPSAGDICYSKDDGTWYLVNVADPTVETLILWEIDEHSSYTTEYAELVELLKEESTVQEAIDHVSGIATTHSVFTVDVDWPKKENTSDSTSEQGSEELTTVHAHINSLLPDHVVVGDDDSDEIYSLTQDIGDENTPVYVKAGVLTATKMSGGGSSIDQNAIQEAVVKALAVSMPSAEQIKGWAKSAATAVLNGTNIAKWSSVVKQITLDADGKIIAINGAGFLTDDAYTELFAAYMDAEGKSKFATLMASVYKDELGNITSEITAAADKIYEKAYKEIAMGVYEANSDTIVSGLIANEDFLSLVYQNVESGVSSGITMDTVLKWEPVTGESVSISDILLNAYQIQTGNQTKVLNLLTNAYDEKSQTNFLSGFVSDSTDALESMLVGMITTTNTSLNQFQESVNGVMTINNGDTTSIALIADEILIGEDTNIKTFIGNLATYDTASGTFQLNPIEITNSAFIDAILQGNTSLGSTTGGTVTVQDWLKDFCNTYITSTGGTGIQVVADEVVITAATEDDTVQIKPFKYESASGKLSLNTVVASSSVRTEFNDAIADLENLASNPTTGAVAYKFRTRWLPSPTVIDTCLNYNSSISQGSYANIELCSIYTDTFLSNYSSRTRGEDYREQTGWLLQDANTKIIWDNSGNASHIVLPNSKDWIGARVTLSSFDPSVPSGPDCYIIREDAESIYGAVQGTYSACELILFSQGIVELLCVPSEVAGRECEWFITNQRCVKFDICDSLMAWADDEGNTIKIQQA